jgi:hypothetical protein
LANRLGIRSRLHADETLYDESAARLTELRSGSPEGFKGEAEGLWLAVSELLSGIRALEAAYWQACGQEVRHER